MPNRSGDLADARQSASVSTGAESGHEPDGFSLWPHLLAMAIVVLLFGSLMGPLSSNTTLTVAAAVAGLGVLHSLARNGPVAWRTILLAVLVVAIVAFRGYIEPPSTIYGQTKLINFCTLTFVTMITAVAVTSGRAVRALAAWWVLVGLVLAGLAVLGEGGAAGGRAEVEGSNPVWLGRALAASVVIAVCLGATKCWRWRRLVLILPVLVAGLLATGSRGPALATIVGVVVLVLAPTARRSRQVVWLIIFVTIGLVAGPMIPALSNSRFAQFISGEVGGEESRADMWREALRVIPDHPWGAGLGNWSGVSMSSFEWPHNIFLEVLVEQGWAVGTALILFVGSVIRRLWRSSGDDPVLQLALALVATETIHVSTSGDLNARTFFFVLMLGAALLVKQRIDPEPQAAPVEDSLQETRQRVSRVSASPRRPAMARRD